MTETPYLATTAALPAVLDLIHSAFAGMTGRIDPPSSVHRLTLADLTLPGREVWVIGQPPRACMVLTPQAETLYLGKLAVAATARRQGMARILIAQALIRAAALGHPTLTLQTRVELTENHATFTRLGFAEIARTAHDGYDHPTTITYRRAI